MRRIQRAAVIGAGSMGAGIAAHLASAGIPTLLLDLPSEGKDRDEVARKGIERALKSRPAAFMDPAATALVHVGNTEDHLDKLKDVDWVVEAVLERLDVKQDLLARLEKAVGPNTIVSSNSSGIPMSLQTAKLGADFKKRFLGTHFFNPPRYLHLLEIIPTPETDPEVLASIIEFGDRVLGKGIVKAHDVPGFAANRIGMFCSARTLWAMDKLGLTPDVVDALTGPLVGHPKSATFRTLDVVGLDVAVAVATGLEKATKEGFGLPPFVAKMMEKKMYGDKTGGGFYKKVKEGGQTKILTLNLETFEYEDKPKVRLKELGPILALPKVEDRIAALLELEGPVGDFTRESFIPQIHYAAKKVGEVADTPAEVDNSLRWGFGWDQGPLELADLLGREKVLAHFQKLGLDTPDYFNHTVDSKPAAAHAPLSTRTLHRQNRVVLSNASASLLDAGDGVAVLEFHSKANSIGQEILELMDQAHDKVKSDFIGLVVGNEGENFSAGADLGMLLQLSEERDFEKGRAAVKIFQGMTSRLRHSPYPVVAAAHKVTLGGGCEVALWADRCVASAEYYTGLVEVGVGILPAGGGTTEMLLRAYDRLLPGSDPFLAVQQVFELIAMCKVSTSAAEANKFGFLRNIDRIVFNQDRLLDEAKSLVLELAPGYAPPPLRRITVLGETALANLRAGAMLLCESGQITPYEVELATKVAEVLTGGSSNRPETVTEEYLLDMECESLLHLIGNAKTRERMAHTLKTGKTLRN